MSTTQPKAVYCLYYAALSCLVPYMSLYYQQRGMTGAQIGILAGLIPLITLGSSPFWGGIADATRRHRAVLLFNIAGLWLAVLGLLFAGSFLTLLLGVVAYAIFVGPIVPLVDNAVMDLLGERKADYGRVRAWGAVGWGLTAAAMGPILQRAGLSWGFYGFLVFMALCWMAASQLTMGLSTVRQAYSASLGVLVGNGRFLLLLAVALLYGIGIGVLLSYQFLFLEQLGASRTLMALSLTVSTLSELPFWFLGSWLLRRFGISRMVVLALLATILRYFALSFMQAPWLVLPISLLHGPSFAILWAALVADADAAAPPGVGATAQGLVSGALFGMGSALGGFVGGPTYEAIGFARLFALIGWLVVAALLLFLAGRLIPRARRNRLLAQEKS
ncbi:MFS transporter [Promineifilum sp.]|uniref:MFS transporter n=1 Tax=Promineifilum sp. TaxID=2664178 RepID=UPI0035AEFC2D